MEHLIILPLASLALAASANAQTSRTTTIEKPKGTATKTVIRDKGNLTVDASATRNSDGATATRNRERTKTEDGVSGSGRPLASTARRALMNMTARAPKMAGPQLAAPPTSKAERTNMTPMVARPTPVAKTAATSRATAHRSTTVPATSPAPTGK